ncbi:acetyl-CoA C-acyltransferase [Hwanghaeella grinnelliae]|uniref:Acetyl-CoA C-acyltransferase n=1 Tax=Hwanghaeella grinnelliae TaxID=2500179 RepID=A0A437QYK3_9PROT|nr:acetyl-CoA C-acyltransferase [Hwanghaeella grinnelliae]RVU39582.1 acetyl-CoA C-acyltransferase [Hwanghaeella grinnelliae]
MTDTDPIVICSARRTPLGAFTGALSPLPAPVLGAAAIAAALEDAGVDPGSVGEVMMGCVLTAGQGQAPARQAARMAGLPDHVGATTVNKVCGSGMKTIMTAADLLSLGRADLIVAGGMEAMSRAPHLLAALRGGQKSGAATLVDHMLFDGLEDAYQPGRSMGSFGETTAREYGFTRKDQDIFAIETLERAQAALSSGAFEAEIAPVTVPGKKGDIHVSADERPGLLDSGKISTLRPAFAEDGTITAASASGNADGAAALVLAPMAVAKARGLPILARIAGQAAHAQEPERYTTAPISAIRKLLAQTGWKPDDVDLWEINEAFAVVAMAAAKDIGIPREKLNVNGGACALGHPIGASGARIVVTLICALRAAGKRRGVASLCIGGGEATALAIQIEN